MQAISQSSAHAIRVLTFLAQQPAGEFQLVRRLADALELPAPYLAKILQPLTNRGLLESQRGRGGGFRLARAPAELSLRQIVDALDTLQAVRLYVALPTATLDTLRLLLEQPTTETLEVIRRGQTLDR